MRLVKCPNCGKRFLIIGPAKSKNYVRMFTHLRHKHWDVYLDRGRKAYDDLKGLIG